MDENVQDLAEVLVKPEIKKDRTVNPMAITGGRMISIEEASRFANGFDDPARLSSAFAGVAGDVGTNAVAIRGNAPQFTQWRLEGIEIPNPTHFADLSGLGGGFLSGLSTQVIGNSDFYNGAFPAEYSNALSGVFDMHLRNGNNQKYEHAFQVGLMGIDLASEGPINKKRGSSYLINYRFSTTSLASGNDINLKYQDLAFKLNFPTRKAGTFSIWGLGLIDRNKAEVLDRSEWETMGDRSSGSNKLDKLAGKQDVLRYVLTANAPETKDNDFTWKDFQARNNNELVAVYGNFVNRAMVLTQKYFDGRVPAQGELTDYDKETLKEFADVKAEVEKLLDVFKFRDAQKEAMNLARIGNKYLADTEPWKLAKTDMERVGTILNISLQLVANLAIAFDPFLPFSSETLRKMLNMDTFEWSELGRDDLLPVGHQLNKPELLFEKIEDATIEAQVQKLLDTKKANEEANYKANPIRPNIEFDDFTKLDIRVGTILECQKVPKADKLLQFKIDDGLETRTIVSGIAKHYQPEELVGKQVCFIANLAPRKLKGIVSEGMILSAENNDGSLAVIMPGREVKPGSEVK